MSDRRITFEALNAYVDGELDPSAAAEVARAIADDPALARQVSALSRLRSAVAESAKAPSPSLDLPAPAIGPRTALAACAALVILVAGALTIFQQTNRSETDRVEQAWRLHRGWSVESTDLRILSASSYQQYASNVPGAYIPDLSASKLSLVHAAIAPIQGIGKALLAGYRGTRGCKISLIVFPAKSPLSESLTRFHDGGNEAYGWRTGSLSYVLLSDGMDSERFRLLAESVLLTSREHLPFDEKTRLALRDSRNASAPCAA